MANSLPFNAVAVDGEYDRVYKAEDWAWYFATFIANGIFPKPSDGLQVVAYSGMEIRVNAGYAFINGYAFRNPATLSVTLDTAEGALNRVDRVVVRWDLPQRDMYIAVLKGTPSAKPTATAVTRTTEIWELALADIYVGKGVTRIQTQNITDQRFNSAVCGIVTGTVEEIDASVLTKQFTDFFNTYSAAVLDEFSAYKQSMEKYLRGTQLKIGNDIAYANYIEDKIVNEDYSPAAVLGELKAQGKEGDFSVTVCVTTLYSYIDKGIFLKLSNKNLPVKKNKKRNYKKVQRQQKRAAAGESIDKRPKEIDTREEFGNWEMDSVLGKRGKSKNTLLVLTERKTRNEIIFKLPDHTDEAVVAALDRLERKWGADMFKRVFKTITVDNGSEFADAEGLQRSIINEGEKRTKVYYCHPYSSWERGTNEVTNKMIRRKIPKGTNFDDRTEEEVESIENWINGYPRKIHGYHSAGELFEEEVKQLA